MNPYRDLEQQACAHHKLHILGYTNSVSRSMAGAKLGNTRGEGETPTEADAGRGGERKRERDAQAALICDRKEHDYDS